MAGQVHRFRDSVGAYLGTGETVYLDPDNAERMGRALLAAARSIRAEPFSASRDLTVEIETADAKHRTLPRTPAGRLCKIRVNPR